ncbi:unnamed protein product [Strongylus vulgaris]|uniref:Uncharacterized protein n=1 Tax=Strongylus vulgaris TaxID=40348 RepID=A0A3P7JML5_STRVU|nr:unnamed protein product [Strongylus vulgaris]
MKTGSHWNNTTARILPAKVRYLGHKGSDGSDKTTFRPTSTKWRTSLTRDTCGTSSIQILDAQPVEQAGFRQGFSCVRQTQTVSRTIEVCREYHLPLVLTFAGYEKAFDSGWD